jgi:hypothetical protein
MMVIKHAEVTNSCAVGQKFDVTGIVCVNNRMFIILYHLSADFFKKIYLFAVKVSKLAILDVLEQWFPNGVSRHPGVLGGTTRCVAKLKKIFKLRLMMIINN